MDFFEWLEAVLNFGLATNDDLMRLVFKIVDCDCD